MILESHHLPSNLSLNAVKILAALYDADGVDLNVTEIAIRTGMHNVSSSDYLHKLEQAGLVSRRVHPRDRRQSLFALTRKGRAHVATWQPNALAFPA